MGDSAIICILGMHRSGTSLTSRILNLLGVNLGPDERLVRAAADNPKGFWEYQPIVNLNKGILSRLGGKCFDPPPLHSGWEHAPQIEDLRRRARTLVEQDFGCADVWGWKDPRTCLTLPFWQHILPSMRYVICLRNPADVARSLERRDGLSLEQAINLWLVYMKFALQHTDGQERIFVAYEDLMDNHRHELQRLARFVGKPERAEQADVQNAVHRFIDPKLQHHRTPTMEATADAQPTAGALALSLAHQVYTRLRQDEQVRQSEIAQSLAKAMDTLSPEIRKQKQQAYDSWLEELHLTTQQLTRVISPGDTVILVNEDQWQSNATIAGCHSLPFLERDGHYWGPPPDDDTAILELERLRQAGASFMVFAWPALPWLAYYPGLHHHLRSTYRCVLEDDRVIAFDLRS